MQKQLVEKLEGRVASVIYYNEENGYTVLRMDVDDGSKAMVVGCIPMVMPGENMTAWGSWTRHPSYGEQFKANYVERTMPTGAAAIYVYLSSGAIKGVGPATAALIVGKFGDDSLEVLRDHPEKLATLRGISRQMAVSMSAMFRRQTSIRSLMEYLAGAGIAPLIALRLYRIYGDDALAAVEDNPYILASTQIGVTFAQADALALSHGMEANSPQRVMAALLFELQHNTENGHCFLPADKLTAATAQFIGVDIAEAEAGLDMLRESGEVNCEPVGNVQACYLASLYTAEIGVAFRLRQMADYRYPSEHVDVKRIIEKLEGEQGIRFAPQQRQTLDAAVSRQLVVITGGPGTGKTTSVRAVLALFDAMGLNTMLAAPTGQAAKRLSDLTGREASTIHRLLEASFSPETDSSSFNKNLFDRLLCDALILDECSMVDIELMQAVLQAIRPPCRLVLVGDVDQLPSVGPGSVFRDLIRSGVAETVRLTEIFRQKQESRIVLCAHQINRGEMPDLQANTGGFYFLRQRDAKSAAETIVSLCQERLPQKMGIPPDQIQVLTPTRKGVAGTEELNKRLQQALNPPAPGSKNEFDFAGHTFREGDRVMQIRNDYEMVWKTASLESGHGIFNGDIGYIDTIDPAAQVFTVDFDGRRAEYVFDQASELDHAWATTVHKAQGSEYRAVVLAAVRAAPQLMYRSLLYTAVTRAAELLAVVGDEEVIRTMTANEHRDKRYSGLRIRLLRDDGI